MAELLFIIACVGWFWMGWWGSQWPKNKKLKGTRFTDDFARIAFIVMGLGMIGFGIYFIVGMVPWVNTETMNWYGILIIISGAFTFILTRVNWNKAYKWGQHYCQDGIEGLRDYSVFYTRFDKIHRVYLMILGTGLVVAGFLVSFGVFA